VRTSNDPHKIPLGNLTPFELYGMLSRPVGNKHYVTHQGLLRLINEFFQNTMYTIAVTDSSKKGHN
jgi:hypothetical protein